MVAQAWPPPFVGRVTERDAYQQMLSEERGPWLLDISGQSGNGKSRLLAQFRVETPDAWRVGQLNFAIDYLRTDPLRLAKELADALHPLAGNASYQQFRQVYGRGRDRLSQFSISLQQQVYVGADAQAQGISQSINTESAINEIRRHVQEQVTDALLDLASGASNRCLVLLLDTCEWLREPGSQEVGDWLVNDLMPRLRERLGNGLRVVAAGREPLPTSAAVGEVRRLSLGLLPFSDVEDYLRQVDMQDANLRQATFDMTRGHPLCLTIVADLWQERPFAHADLLAFQGQFSDRAVIQWVQERVLDKRMQPPFDDLVRYGVLLRSFDLPLLRQVFPEWVGEGDTIFQRLIRYSFIIPLTNRRYAFHDLLRQVQTEYVRRQLPERWRQYHERALHAWQEQPEQVFGRQLPPPDYYYHWLALEEQQGEEAWESSIDQASVLGDWDYWGRMVEAAYDIALSPTLRLQAKRAYERGIFAYYGTQWNLALSSYQQALGFYEQLNDALGLAKVCAALGDLFHFHRQENEALQAYNRALTLYQYLDNLVGKARVLFSIATIHYFRDGSEAALSNYEEALTLYQEASHIVGQANVLLGIGDLFTSQTMALVYAGDISSADQKKVESLQCYNQALEFYQQADDRLGQANTWNAMGTLLQLSGQTREAFASYKQALKFYQEIGERLGQANCLKNLGFLAFSRLREYRIAVDFFTDAYDLYQQVQNASGQASLLSLRSYAYQAAGELDGSIQDAERALEIAQRLNLRQIVSYRQRLDEVRGGAELPSWLRMQS